MSFSSWRSQRRVLAAATVVMVSLVVAACGSDDSSSSSSSSSSSASTTADASASSGGGALAAAQTQLEAAYKGRFTSPPTTPNPAAKGKNVWFISPGQASPNAAATWAAADVAGKKMGWKMTLYDAKLDPANYSIGIRQAVAAGADGILLIAIDCSQTKSALQVAKNAGVKTVDFLAFDCNDVDPSAKPLFSAGISLGDRFASWPEAYQKWGSDVAAWTIAQTNGKPNVLNFNNDEFQLIVNLDKGFNDRMKECGADCKLDTIPWTVAEAGPKIAAKVQASILRNPDANALQDGANPGLGFSTGVVQAGKVGKVQVAGALGLPSDVALLKDDKGLDGFGAWPIEWWSWAAVDTLNSVFNDKKPDDSGLGWQMVDRKHNLPAGAAYEPDVDYKGIYSKRWGIG